MLHGEEVYKSIELTDDVQTARLSILDQIRLMLANFSNDDVAELDKVEKVSKDKLKKIAALTQFIDKAVARMHEMGEESVTIKLSSEFLPYVDEVLSDKDGYGRYYDFKVVKKDIPINVKHTFIVRIFKKNDAFVAG